MLDTKASKAYRKIVCAKSDYEAFKIIDRLKPEEAKRVFIRYIMNQIKEG